MKRIEKKHILLKILLVFITLLLVFGFFLFPILLKNETELVLMNFTVEAKSVKDDTLFLRGYFEQNLREGESLWLYAENAKIGIHINDAASYYNETQKAVSILRSPGSGWYHYDSPELKKGDRITFSVHSYYAENETAADTMLSRLYTGDGSGLYQLMMKQITFIGVVLFCSIVAGIIYLVEGVIDILLGMTDAGARIFISGLYCLTGGLGCVASILYPYLTLLISSSLAVVVLEAIGLLLFPVILLVMIWYYIRGKWAKRIMEFAIFTEIITAIICVFQQLGGSFDISQNKITISIVTVAAMVTATICIVSDLYHYRSRSLLFLLLTVLPVFISMPFNCIHAFYPYIARNALVPYCFTLSLFLMIFQLVSYAKEEKAKEQKLRHIENELAESKISITLSQIQPHFLFNSLISIKQLCDSKSPETSDALEHFTFYLRGNLDSLSNVKFISFVKEIEHIRNYLYLQKMRFGDKLNISYELTYEDFMIPPLTVQPIVENAVHHGIFKKKNGGTLSIKSERMESFIIITVKDDGIGFDPEVPLHDGHTHIGIENVKKRLDSLCGGSLFVESRKGDGTTVKIILPRNRYSPLSLK